MNKLRVLLVALFLTTITLGQDAVQLLKKEVVIDVSVGSKKELVIQVSEYSCKKILDQSRVLGYMQEESIYYQDAFETNPSVDAYTLVPKENGKMKKVVVTDIHDEDHFTRGIFYSGTKKKTVNFHKVETGTELHCTFSYMVKDAHLLPSFFFNDYFACDSAILKVIVSPSVDLGHLDVFNGFDDKIQFTQTESKGSKTFLWKGSGFQPRIYEDDSGGPSCSNPHVIPYVKSFKVNNGPDVNVLRNEADLFSWYSTLVQDYQLSENHSAILDSLKQGNPTNEVLAERIFNWVQHSIKYIAYEEGIEGFQPRNPNDVVKNRFGDCKDMAVLTSTMMKQVGIPCHYAWVGTRDKCYTYESCPTPSVDNHMIAAFPTADGFVFLDPTSTYAEFGVPSSFVQGKEAMVRVSKDEFKIVKIPMMEPSYSIDYDSILVNLEEQTLIGRGQNRLTGFQKVDYENALTYSGMSPEKCFVSYHDYGNNSFAIRNLIQENTNSNQGDLRSNFEFEVKNYVEIFDQSVYINPFLKPVIDLELAERTKSLLLDYKYQKGAHVTIFLEEGMTPVNGLQSKSISENGLELTIKSVQVENRIEVDYLFTCNRDEILASENEDVRATLSKMKKELKQRIELKNEN